MSNTITNLCRPLRLQPVRKCVLMALADRADDNGVAWPSLAWLCEWTCFSRRAVMNALEDLGQAGFVRLSKAAGCNTRYEIAVDLVRETAVEPGTTCTTTRAPRAPVEEPEACVNPGTTCTGAADAPVHHVHHYPCTTCTTTRAPRAPGGAPRAPDTSISIIETSIKTSNSCVIGAANVPTPSLFELEAVDQQQAPAAKQKHQYCPEFEASWTAYPTRPGDSKQSAFKQWQARLKAGATAEEMAAGIVAYATYVKANRTEPKYIKHAATFLGTDMHFRSDWSVVAEKGREHRSYGPGASGRFRPSHSGFDKINYSEGIDENGYIIG